MIRYWANDRPPPPALRPRPTLFDGQVVAASDGVVWGASAPWDRLTAEPGARVWATRLGDVELARARGLTGVLIPDLSAETLQRAASGGWNVPRGTLWPDSGELWVEGGVERLAPQLHALARDLARGVVPSDSERRVAVARLRRQLGGGVVSQRGRGWRLVNVQLGVPAVTDVVWRELAASRYAPEQHVAERIPGGERAALTGPEVAVLERLWRAAGGVVSEDVLRREARRAVPVVVHRLRQKLGDDAIATVRGRGYRLVVREVADSTPLLPRVERFAAAHPLVALTGSVGAGKTTWLNRLAGARGQRILDLDGLSPATQDRRLAALAEQAPRSVVVDGVRDGRGLSSRFAAMVEAGFRIVVGARVPPFGAAVVALDPPDPDWLRSEDVERRLERVADVPDLDRCASFPGGFDDGDVPRGSLRAWRALGVVGGDGRQRLPLPLCEAVWSTWSPAQRVAWAESAVARALRVAERRPYDEAALDGAVVDVCRATAWLQEAGRPAVDGIALVGVFDASSLRAEWFDAELGRPGLTGNERARVLFARFMVGTDTDVDLLRSALASATGETWADVAVQLAYYLHATDPTQADHLLAEVDTWLLGQPADAARWVRSEALLVNAQRRWHPDLLEPLTALAVQLETDRIRGVVGGALFEGMRRRTLHCLGQCLLRADRPADAVVALRMSVDAGTGSPLPWGAVELVVAWGRLGRWDEARRVSEACAPYLAQRPTWAALLHVADGLNALWRGDRAAARARWQVSVPSPTVRRTRAFLGALLDAWDGGPVPDRAGFEDWMSPAQRAAILEDLADDGIIAAG